VKHRIAIQEGVSEPMRQPAEPRVLLRSRARAAVRRLLPSSRSDFAAALRFLGRRENRPAGPESSARLQATLAGEREQEVLPAAGQEQVTLSLARFPEDGTLTPEMEQLNAEAAMQLQVEPSIHPQDFIYRFCCAHPLLTLESGIEYYFRDGRRSSAKLADLLAGFTDLDPHCIRLLEFGSGYGCVTRHLRKLPQFDLVACDIHQEAIDFLTHTIGVRSIMSKNRPAEFLLPDKYDVVFALSFFSHMPETTFGGWLRALLQTLHVPGYLIFTTHGTKSCPHMGIRPEDIPASGSWFSAGSEQFDLDTAEYGTAITTPDFVIPEIYRQTGAPIVTYRHAFWWEHQDLWVVKRVS